MVGAHLDADALHSVDKQKISGDRGVQNNSKIGELAEPNRIVLFELVLWFND